jgi:anti-sigma regulatory factor (Ser/Thr protein kinase)
MVNDVHLRLNASDRSYFAILKKDIHALAEQGGFADRRLGEIDIVVSEIVSNLSKHAKGGELLVKLIEQNGIQGIEIIAIDEGPGIPDVPRMMKDGISTSKTLGHGLGAIQRLSDKFQLYSLKDWGTVLLSRIFSEELPYHKKEMPEVRSLVVPKPGETACGDAFCYIGNRSDFRFFLADGLGHGEDAAAAANAAVNAFRNCTENSPVEILRTIHQAVKKTRGLVGTVVVFDLDKRVWKICGIGNILTRLQAPGTLKNYVAHNGIIGLNIPGTMKDQETPYEPLQQLVMCSDGIRSRWETLRHQGLTRYDLSIMNALIFKDFARDTDDMSVASCKINL